MKNPHQVIETNEMDADGFWAIRKERRFIGPADEMLAKLSAESGSVVKAISEPVPGSVLSMGAKAGIHYVWGQVRQITLNCEWKSAGGVLTPIFRAATQADESMAFPLKWDCPESMKLFFMVLADKPNASYRFVEAYMVAVGLPPAKGWRRLPLTNIHDDGKLCLGGEYKGKTATSISGLWADAFSHFNNSRFNGDLMRDSTMAMAEKMFKFDASTSQPKPVPADWPSYCSVVNNSAYSFITP